LTSGVLGAEVLAGAVGPDLAAFWIAVFVNVAVLVVFAAIVGETDI
jgi:hypothetical protein